MGSLLDILPAENEIDMSDIYGGSAARQLAHFLKDMLADVLGMGLISLMMLMQGGQVIRLNLGDVRKQLMGDFAKPGVGGISTYGELWNWNRGEREASDQTNSQAAKSCIHMIFGLLMESWSAFQVIGYGGIRHSYSEGRPQS